MNNEEKNNWKVLSGSLEYGLPKLEKEINKIVTASILLVILAVGILVYVYVCWTLDLRNPDGEPEIENAFVLGVFWLIFASICLISQKKAVKKRMEYLKEAKANRSYVFTDEEKIKLNNPAVPVW